MNFLILCLHFHANSSQQRKVRSFGLPYEETKPDWHFVDESQCWLTSLVREKKEILVSVLLDLRDGAFSFTTELSNSSLPSCVVQIWMLAQMCLTCSHFQGKILTFWLHASYQGHQVVRSLNFWTKENSWCYFFFPKAFILLLILPNHPFVLF